MDRILKAKAKAKAKAWRDYYQALQAGDLTVAEPVWPELSAL